MTNETKPHPILLPAAGAALDSGRLDASGRGPATGPGEQPERIDLEQLGERDHLLSARPGAAALPGAYARLIDAESLGDLGLRQPGGPASLANPCPDLHDVAHPRRRTLKAQGAPGTLLDGLRGTSHAPRVRKEKDPFSAELGRRIDEAWQRAGFASRMAMFRESALPDYNQLARWCRGVSVPEVRSLATIAKVCRVSLDWLVFGSEETPGAFLDWLETATGHGANDEAKRFLRSLPLHGYRPTPAFYDLAYQAWKHGVTASADDLAQMARDTEQRS